MGRASHRPVLVVASCRHAVYSHAFNANQGSQGAIIDGTVTANQDNFTSFRVIAPTSQIRIAILCCTADRTTRPSPSA